jgi:hypothetical protein
MQRAFGERIGAPANKSGHFCNAGKSIGFFGIIGNGDWDNNHNCGTGILVARATNFISRPADDYLVSVGTVST